MTRQELRVFLMTWYCGCGSPESATDALYRILRAFVDREPPNDYVQAWRLVDEWFPDEGMRYLMLYWLTNLDLIEHGGSVNASWITGKGENVLEALEREKADGFVKLHDHFCAHGFDIEGPDTHNCMAADLQREDK